MNFGSISLAFYAVVMGVGGVFAFVKTQSKPSLIAGLGSAVILAIAFSMAQSKPKTAFLIGAVVALINAISLGMRYSKTGNFMPAGFFCLVSVIALLELSAAWFSTKG